MQNRHRPKIRNAHLHERSISTSPLESREAEIVLINENPHTWSKREALPHVADAWIDESKIGYTIPLSRHFYQYEPPRPLGAIEPDIKTVGGDILKFLVPGWAVSLGSA